MLGCVSFLSVRGQREKNLRRGRNPAVLLCMTGCCSVNNAKGDVSALFRVSDGSRHLRRRPLPYQMPQVPSGGAAAKAGVRVDDVVVSIDGSNSSVAYKNLIQIIGALGRPVVVGFQRGGGDAGGGAGQVGTRGEEFGPLQRAQEAARRKLDGMKGPPQVRREG